MLATGEVIFSFLLSSFAPAETSAGSEDHLILVSMDACSPQVDMNAPLTNNLAATRSWRWTTTAASLT